MAHDAHVGFRDAQEPGHIHACLLVIESQDDYRAFALFQALHTAGELFMIEAWLGRLDRRP